MEPIEEGEDESEDEDDAVDEEKPGVELEDIVEKVDDEDDVEEGAESIGLPKPH